SQCRNRFCGQVDLDPCACLNRGLQTGGKRPHAIAGERGDERRRLVGDAEGVEDADVTAELDTCREARIEAELRRPAGPKEIKPDARRDLEAPRWLPRDLGVGA